MPLRCSLPPTARTRRASRNRPRPVKSSQIGISSASNIASKSVARSAAIRRTIAVVSGLSAGPGFLIDLALVFPGMSRRCPSSYLSSKSCTRTRRIASRHDLDLGAEGLRRGAAVPPATGRDLAAAEHQEDDLRLVDAIDEARELLRLVFDRTGPEGDRDRVEVERGAEVRGRDDVLDLDLRVLLNRDAGRLDLLRDEVDRGLDVLEALRAGADDFTAAEQEDRGLRLLDAIDEAGELLRLVLGATEGEGDRLEVELAPEGGRRNHVLDPEVGHGEPPRRALQAVAV